jgi:hypothetical protein
VSGPGDDETPAIGRTGRGLPCMLHLEREYASRFPERTRADALRTRGGSRILAGQPTGR